MLENDKKPYREMGNLYCAGTEMRSKKHEKKTKILLILSGVLTVVGIAGFLLLAFVI